MKHYISSLLCKLTQSRVKKKETKTCSLWPWGK